jgi:hypothetical protein
MIGLFKILSGLQTGARFMRQDGLKMKEKS